MIIDAHAHVTAPQELYEFFRSQSNMSGMGRAGGIRDPFPSDDRIEELLRPHLAEMDSAGTDFQLISPEPWELPTAERRPLVQGVARQLNDFVAACVRLHPDRFAGVAAVPQSLSLKPIESAREIDRCVNDLGFVGVMLNPDPGEGGLETPHMGDDYWYPIYERMTELNVPGLIHAGNCRFARQPMMDYVLQEENVTAYGILRSPNLFRDFPTLKLIVAHGGGYVPYQFGRGRSFRLNEMRRAKTELETFEESIKHLYFDTVLFDAKALSLLFRLVGVDRCLFGSDQPEYSSVIDPKTERSPHDIRPLIESIDWLTEADRRSLFEETTRKVFSRLKVPASA